MMPVPNEYHRVLDLLEKKTDAHTLKWRETGRDGELVARLPDYSVSLSINRFTEIFNLGMDVKSPVSFELLLPEGMEVGRFEVRPEEAEYPRVRQLFDLARASAVKKADMVRAVETQLQGL